MAELKDTNPKDAIGAKKLALHLVPDTVQIYAAMAFTEGALKYGKFNWRKGGARASIYLDALERHLIKYRNGEWEDPETKVPHLANALACIGILLDAKECGVLVDDRPPIALMGPLLKQTEDLIAHLKTIFAECHPHQHTILDGPNGNVQPTSYRPYSDYILELKKKGLSKDGV